jgi:N-acetylglucosaminyldiphosphoundecaprenol N-acetyl-beta-D-mannosaminyltransferase
MNFNSICTLFDLINEKYLNDLSMIANFTPERNFIICMNPHSFVSALSDENFLLALKKCDHIVIDGIGLKLALSLIYKSQFQRITGHDVFRYASYELESCALIGSSKSNLDKIEKRILTHCPNVSKVGKYSPPFQEHFTRTEIQKIEDFLKLHPYDWVFLGMTAPKQEKLILSLMGVLQAANIVGIGAVFDYESGSTRVPSKYIRYFGIEWVFRLITNPQKMWRRVFITAPKFVFYTLCAVAWKHN